MSTPLKMPKNVFLNFDKIKKTIKAYYERKGYVWPDGQDAATFTAQEAVEAIDIILRRKNYVRNHEKKNDKSALGRELAQCFLMLMITFIVEDLNPEFEFSKLILSNAISSYFIPEEKLDDGSTVS